MGFEARVLNVLIASPGDAMSARDAVEGTVLSWNRDRARASRVVLLSLRWEVDAVPELGAGGQAIINRQLIDDADIVIGLFQSRLGKPTERHVSGTAEELQQSLDRGAKVHVYFSEMPHSHDVDPEQLQLLNAFREDLKERGLLGSFRSLDDLKAKVRTALERDIQELVVASAEQSRGDPSLPSAILRARYEYDREPHTDPRGRTRMRSRNERLVIENIGTAAAERVSVDIDPVGEGEPPSMWGEKTAERIPPQAHVRIPLSVHMGVATQWRVTLRWVESGVEHEEVQTVTPF